MGEVGAGAEVEGGKEKTKERGTVVDGKGGPAVVIMERVGEEEAAEWELDARFVGHQRAQEEFFSKVRSIVALYRKYTRSLTFENL